MNAHRDAREGQQTASAAETPSVPTVDAAAVQEGHYPEPHGKDWWCAECLQVLDGEDGVCNLVLLARLAERWATDYFAMRDDCNAMATKAATEFNRAEELARRVIELERVARSLGALLKDEWPSEYSLALIADLCGRSDDDVRAVEAWERAQPWGWIGGG